MISIENIILQKKPKYPLKYEVILNKIARKGGGSTESAQNQGKSFDNLYEGFMYAFMIGFINKNRVPLPDEGKTFIEIMSWKPERMRDFMVATLFTLDDTHLIAYEKMEEAELRNKVSDLIHLMEQYACGGFEILDEAIKSKQEDFGQFTSMVDFLISQDPK